MGASDDVDPRDPEGHLVHEVCVTSIVNCDCTTLGYEDLVYQVCRTAEPRSKHTWY